MQTTPNLSEIFEKMKKEYPGVEIVIDDSRPVFRVIVAGSRSFGDYSLLSETMDTLLKEKKKTHDISIVCGKAQGADTLGEKYARERGYEVAEFPAKWDEYGKSAGHLRNEQMAMNADALVAFWDGQSRGTRDMIGLARKHGLKTRVRTF